MAGMRIRHVYLIFCALGFLLPYSQFAPRLREHGLDLSLFVSDLFANRIGAFFGMDVLVSTFDRGRSLRERRSREFKPGL
jgi:hypothetical protein